MSNRIKAPIEAKVVCDFAVKKMLLPGEQQNEQWEDCVVYDVDKDGWVTHVQRADGTIAPKTFYWGIKLK